MYENIHLPSVNFSSKNISARIRQNTDKITVNIVKFFIFNVKQQLAPTRLWTRMHLTWKYWQIYRNNTPSYDKRILTWSFLIHTPILPYYLHVCRHEKQRTTDGTFSLVNVYMIKSDTNIKYNVVSFQHITVLLTYYGRMS